MYSFILSTIFIIMLVYILRIILKANTDYENIIKKKELLVMIKKRKLKINWQNNT